MKKPFLFLSAAAIALLLSFTACDPCEDVNCQNGGTCNEGECLCISGYEGVDCETQTSLKYLGTHSATSECGTGPQAFTCTVTQDPAAVDGIIFDNFSDLWSSGQVTADPIKATVDGITLTVAEQVVDNATITATGIYNGTDFVMTVTFTEAGTSLTCTDTYNLN